MSKVRIYELAKELGVENKMVLELCEQVGVSGKSSHSSALNEDEADKIRRHFIRSNVVDNDTERQLKIEGQVITEKRVSGNVIRRRKKDEDEKEEINIPKVEEAPREVLSDPLYSVSSTLSAKEKIDAALGIIDDIKVNENLDFEVEVDISQDNIKEEEPKEEVVLAKTTEQAEREEIDEIRKRLDVRAPKVLGKINLPTKVEPQPKRAAAGKENTTSIPGSAAEIEEARSAKKKGKKGAAFEVDRDGLIDGKKPKRKQILAKGDLLDYDGERENFKNRKDKRSKKDKLDPLSEEAIAARAGKRPIKIDGEITVGEMARQMGLKASQVITELMKLGSMAGINQLIDFDTATIVASTFGFETQNVENSIEDMFQILHKEDVSETLVYRPPVVTVMGHVDHGKTSLLDAIRQTTVTKSEAGGITQHIGAYNVKLPSGGSVTFLDTPGHEAFTAMRSRGAQITDIVVLVVAADDGVMPQTIEAINHAKAANVPIIVAINKMDKEGANPDKLINQLSEHGLVPEAWGGDTLVVKVSAHTKMGIEELLETLHLQAEVMEFTANPERPAMGAVVESRVDRGRGPILSILVRNGTLRKGDCFVAGAVSGRVRAMMLDDGTLVEEAGPSIPVEILGASAAAEAGDDFTVTADEAQARYIAEEKANRKRKKEFAQSFKNTGFGLPLTMERFSEMVTNAVEKKDLPVVVKVDVQGSLDALVGSLSNLSNEEVQVKIIHKGVGAVTENDAQLASASGAILVAFNVRPDTRAQAVIEKEGALVLYSRVIYEIVDAVKDALKGKMSPKFEEKFLGRVEVRQTFRVPKLGMIAGSYVLDGTISRNSQVRLLRDGIVVHEGKMASLRRFKDDVKEVQAGYECGIGIDGYSDIKDGDIIEVFKVEEVRH